MAIFGILSGISSFRASRIEAKAQERQGDIAAEEAGREAERVGEARRAFKGTQALSFLKSGVQLKGTAIDVLARTEAETGRQVESIKARGAAQRRLFRKRASITRKGGRARALAAFGQAAAASGGGGGDGGEDKGGGKKEGGDGGGGGGKQ